MLNDALKSIKIKDTNLHQIDEIYKSKIKELECELYMISVFDFTRTVKEIVDVYKKNGLSLDCFYLQLKIDDSYKEPDFRLFSIDVKVKEPLANFKKEELTNAKLLAKDIKFNVSHETNESRKSILDLISRGFTSNLFKRSSTYNYYLDEESLVDNLQSLFLNEKLINVLNKEILSIELKENLALGKKKPKL